MMNIINQSYYIANRIFIYFLCVFLPNRSMTKWCPSRSSSSCTAARVQADGEQGETIAASAVRDDDDDDDDDDDEEEEILLLVLVYADDMIIT